MTNSRHASAMAGRHALIALLTVIALLTGSAGYADTAQDDFVLRIVFFANGYGTVFPCPT